MTEFIVLLGASFLLSLGIFISALFLWHGFDRLDRLNAELRQNLLQEKKQPLSINYLAIKTDTHPSIVRWFLNRKARLFNGLTDVNEFGDIIYYFEEARNKLLEPEEEA